MTRRNPTSSRAGSLLRKIKKAKAEGEAKLAATREALERDRLELENRRARAEEESRAYCDKWLAETFPQKLTEAIAEGKEEVEIIIGGGIVGAIERAGLKQVLHVRTREVEPSDDPDFRHDGWTVYYVKVPE